MSRKITIEIKNKIATCLTLKPVVCDNKNYVCEFIFDEEWLEYSVKTARFVANHQSVDVVFEGNVCKMPPVSNAKVLWVGVYAGDLSTTTSAIVNCTPSILSGNNVPAPPREDIYAQMLSMCDDAVKTAKSVEERANNGEFDGKDVDGSLVANAIKGTARGNFLFLTDVSPIEHTIGVKVRRKNYFDIDALTPLYGATIDVNNNKLTVTTSYAEYPGCRCQVQDKNMYGKSVTISFSYQVLKRWSYEETYKTCRPTMEMAVYNKYGDRLVYKVLRGTMVATESLSLTVNLPAYEDGMYMTLSFHVSNAVDGSSDRQGKQVVFSDIQLEEGTSVTTWVPYIKDLTNVQVKKYRNGAVSERHSVSADGAVYGVTSVYPYTTLSIDIGAVMDCTYNRDLNKVYEAFCNAIIALGGNI